MSTPAGVVYGVGVGVPVEFRAVNGILQRSYSGGVTTAANRGAALTYSATANAVDPAAGTSTKCAGLLGQDAYDPSGIPGRVAENVYADGILTYSQIGQPVSVWKMGEFFVTQVSGAVAQWDYLQPTAGGLWLSSTTTNNLTNGSAIATVGNTSSGGAIQLSLNVN